MTLRNIQSLAKIVYLFNSFSKQLLSRHCFHNMIHARLIAVLWFISCLPLLWSQDIRLIDADNLKEMTSYQNDTTYVINFWATWCSPCIKEIGYFEEVKQHYEGQPVKVALLSLDFPNQLEKRVIPFLKDRQITASAFLMTDMDYNGWINMVDESWSGAIPATLIYNAHKRTFLERELSKEELFTIVEQIHK